MDDDLEDNDFEDEYDESEEDEEDNESEGSAYAPPPSALKQIKQIGKLFVLCAYSL